jgi:hypothetical protein
MRPRKPAWALTTDGGAVNREGPLSEGQGGVCLGASRVQKARLPLRNAASRAVGL